MSYYDQALKKGGGIIENMRNLQVQGKRRSGRQNKIVLENTRDDMEKYDTTEYMAQNRSGWHVNTNAGTLLH